MHTSNLLLFAQSQRTPPRGAIAVPLTIKIDPTLAMRFGAFLLGEEQATVWALEQAIWILSVQPQKGKFFRTSFANWLVPYVLQDLLRLDVITEFTVEGYQQFLKLNDKIAVAWRTAGPADVKRWAEALAKKANVSLQTVYGRQAAWRKKYRIDIALPNAFYRDALYFGANSASKPRDRAATLAAHSARDGKELLRLRDKATLDFDRLRREGVGAMIRAPLHLMPVKVGLINPMAPVIAPAAVSAFGIAATSPMTTLGQAGDARPAPADASLVPGRTGTGTDLDLPLVNRPRAMEVKPPHVAAPAPDDFDDLPPDFDDDGLDDTVPTGPASARPMAKKPRAKIILGAKRSALPPPTVKKLDFVAPCSAPPEPAAKPPASTTKKVVLRGMPSPPPPAPVKKVRLRGAYSPPPPPAAKKLVLGGRRRSPPSTTRSSSLG
jgi:hypothetical protein